MPDRGTRTTPWLLMLGGDAVVSEYDSREEAEAAMAWYVEAYGPPKTAPFVVKRADDGRPYEEILNA